MGGCVWEKSHISCTVFYLCAGMQNANLHHVCVCVLCVLTTRKRESEIYNKIKKSFRCLLNNLSERERKTERAWNDRIGEGES
jgi:hypothetical protein